MKQIPLLFLSALFLVSCCSLPEIKPDPIWNKNENLCLTPFVKEKYRFVHAIESRVAGKTGGAIIGVTVVDPALRFISCAIMTVEGMVLFQAQSGESLKIIKALPPFDAPDFAQNLIDDIRLIYFTPDGQLEEKGTLTDGAIVCRYRQKDGRFLDIITGKNGSTEINLYAAGKSLKRQVILTSSEGIYYQNIVLLAKEMVNYSLIMNLIEAQPTEGELNQDEAKGDER